MKSLSSLTRGFRTPVAALMAVAALCAPPAAWGRPKGESKAASHLKVGENLYRNGRYGEALASVEKAIKADSSYVPAHQLRGQVLVSMDRLEDALESFDRVLALDGKYTEARNWKGYTLIQLRRYEEAMAEYRRALGDLTYATPELIHLNIGKLHRLLGRTDEAIASLRESVRLNPSFARGHYELGATYERMGRDREALKAYQDALVGMADSADLNLRLGLALMKLGDHTKAKEHFEKVIRLAPDGPEAAQARDEIRKLQPTS